MITVYNIKDYGASGDGLTKDTAALQKAIDTCTEAGGGTVYLPPGIYLSGTIRLKDNVTLWLEAGSSILASDDLKNDYNPACLIYAREVKNIAIRGRGTINGNNPAFLLKQDEFKKAIPEWTHPFGLWPWRIRCSAHFLCCENILIEGVSFIDGGTTTLHLMGCAYVNIHDVTINNDKNGWWQDCLYLISCRQARINNCSFTSSDDCVCIYQGCAWFEFPMTDGLDDLSDEDVERLPNEDIIVSDCVLRTHSNGIRVNGSRGGTIRNVSFNNIIIHSDSVGISVRNFYAIRFPLRQLLTWEKAGETEIENISFSNLLVKGGTIGLYILNEDFIGAKKRGRGNIRNISVSNSKFIMEISSLNRLGTFLISGSNDLPLENINFSNVELEVTGVFNKEFHKLISDEVHYPLESYNGEIFPADNNPVATAFRYGIFCRNARNVRFTNVEMSNASSVSWRNALRFDHVSDVSVRHLDIRNPRNLDRADIAVCESKNLFFEPDIGNEDIKHDRRPLLELLLSVNDFIAGGDIKSEYKKLFSEAVRKAGMTAHCDLYG